MIAWSTENILFYAEICNYLTRLLCLQCGYFGYSNFKTTILVVEFSCKNFRNLQRKLSFENIGIENSRQYVVVTGRNPLSVLQYSVSTNNCGKLGATVTSLTYKTYTIILKSAFIGSFIYAYCTKVSFRKKASITAKFIFFWLAYFHSEETNL